MLHRKTFLIRSLDFKLPFQKWVIHLKRNPQTYTIDKKDIVDIKVTEVMATLSSTGIIQYDKFVKRFNEGEISGFYEPIKKNTFAIFNSKTKPEPSMAKRKLETISLTLA